jgi:hypothetical protein
MYCKQVPQVKQRYVADVYCQNINNQNHTQLSYLYETERRGECAKQQSERER